MTLLTLRLTLARVAQVGPRSVPIPGDPGGAPGGSPAGVHPASGLQIHLGGTNPVKTGTEARRHGGTGT